MDNHRRHEAGASRNRAQLAAEALRATGRSAWTVTSDTTNRGGFAIMTDAPAVEVREAMDSADIPQAYVGPESAHATRSHEAHTVEVNGQFRACRHNEDGTITKGKLRLTVGVARQDAQRLELDAAGPGAIIEAIIWQEGAK